MANVDRPNGFRFGKSLTGQSLNAMVRFYDALTGQQTLQVTTVTSIWVTP